MGSMSMFDTLRSFFTGKKYLQQYSNENLYNELNRELYKWIFRGSPHIMDASMENFVTQGYTYNSLIYSIVNYMATTASTVAWVLEQKVGNEVKEITEHPFLDVWHRPNQDQTLIEMIEGALIYKYVTGNTYLYAPRIQTGADKGKVVKFEVMPSHVVQPIFGDTKDIVRGYSLNGETYREIPKESVLHIKYLNPDVTRTSAAVGMSPLKALVTVITQNNDAWRQLAAAFQNGGPAGFFSKDGSTSDAEFSKEQGDFLIERLNRNYSGPSNANKLAAIGGNAKYTTIGLSPVDLNILEAIKVSFVQVCNAFKFPAALLNYDSSLTYNNFAESQRILWTVALKQDLDILGQKITNEYLPAYGEGLTLRPDYSSIAVLQGNMLEMVQWLSQAWWIKGARKQELMGENIDPEMDKYFIPSGILPMDY